MDLDSGNEIFAAKTGVHVDAAAAPDGSTLYVAGLHELMAFDLATGIELWRVHIENRLFYMGTGPSTLAVAPDGSQLFVYSSRTQEGGYGSEFNVPYWLQVVDTATGMVVAHTGDIAGCGSATMSFSADGTNLYLTCPTIAEVVAFDLGSLAPRQAVDVPGVPEVWTTAGEPVGLGPAGQAAGSVTSQADRTNYVVTNEPRANSFGVAVVGAETALTAEEADLGAGGDGGTVAPGAIALVEQDTKLVVGARTGSPYTGAIDQLRAFDTTTWEEVARIDLPELHSTYVAIDPRDGAVYGARIELAEGSTEIIGSEIYRIDLSGAVEPVFVREGEEVLMMFTIPGQ